MRKITVVAFLILFFTMGINSYSQKISPPATQRQMQPWKLNSKSSTKSNIESKDNNNISQNLITPSNAINTQNGDKTTHNSYKQNNCGQPGAIKDDPITRYTFWLTIFTGLLAIFNFLLWIYTMKAANAAKRSAESLPTIERAYIFVDIPKNETAGISTGNTSGKISAGIYIFNYGKTPAILNKINGDFLIAERFPTKFPDVINKIPLDENVLGVNKSMDKAIKGNFQQFDIDNIFAKTAKTTKLFCYGIIHYQDIWKFNHETRFCWEWNPTRYYFIPSDNKLNHYT